jgi:LacI family transcriptional regulator
VFAANDQMALGALRAANLAGRRVPDDLALVGFDNVPESAFYWPSLTTVDQHMRDVGGEAVLNLHRLIEARISGADTAIEWPVLLAPELIVRESSGRKQ